MAHELPRQSIDYRDHPEQPILLSFTAHLRLFVLISSTAASRKLGSTALYLFPRRYTLIKWSRISFHLAVKLMEASEILWPLPSGNKELSDHLINNLQKTMSLHFVAFAPQYLELRRVFYETCLRRQLVTANILIIREDTLYGIFWEDRYQYFIDFIYDDVHQSNVGDELLK